MQVVDPDDARKLERRLAWDDLTEDGLEALLKRVPPSIDRALIGWEQALQDCREALKESWDLPLLPVGSDEQRAFLDLWWPIRFHAEACLEGAFPKGTASLGIEPVVLSQLSDCLLDRLCYIGEQVLWESFNAERSPGTILLAHLGASGDGSGPPVREHYEVFIRRHRRDGLDALVAEFPLLGQFIGTVFALWLESSLEMLRRVCNDRAMLEIKFSVPVDQSLSAVKQGLSDPHRGGRGVAILTFGQPVDQSIRVVYKPKDMGVDAVYQAVLRDLNFKSELEPLRTLTTHPCDGYGYMEYVPHQLCDGEHELKHFYVNAGRLTAVLHLLGCTDCHYENLIACGDQLLLIDTETLLEADLSDKVKPIPTQPEFVHTSVLQKRFQQSVLRSGLLPQWMFLGGAKQPVDISALGISPPRTPQQQANVWIGLNSDGMVPGRVNQAAEIPTSLPVGAGQPNPFSRFVKAFTDGFRIQNQALIAQRHRWLNADSVLGLFAGLPRRIVLRATRVYFAIQRQQLEPEALRSSLGQALKLEQLARRYLLSETKPPNWPVFAAEVKQMQLLDIPFFTHSIDGETLDLDGTKDGLLSGLIQTSALASAYERLKQLDDEEVDFQIRLIQGALEACQLSTATVAESRSEQDDDLQLLPKRLLNGNLEAVTRIAERLLELMIRDPHGQVEWLGVDLGSDGVSFSYGPVGLSLYGGSTGIACLLHCLRKRSAQLAYADEISSAILRPLRDLIDQSTEDMRRRWWRDQPLGLSGCGGILLALVQLGEQELAESLVQVAPHRYIRSDQRLDVIGGCAGLIGPLLELGTVAALQLAILAGDQLIGCQSNSGAWETPAWELPLLGFSHGTAGYAASLARLHLETREPRFRAAAQCALAYERAHFSSKHSNWPDYRLVGKDRNDPNFMAGWCHGAPSIGLGRACLWGTDLWDKQCVEEIRIAMHTTAAKGSLDADHICCGNLGLMLVLRALTSGPWPIDPSLRSFCNEVVDIHLEGSIQRSMTGKVGLRCFSTSEGSLDLPGFFTGLSGMGLAMLEDQQSKAIALKIVSAGLWPNCLME